MSGTDTQTKTPKPSDTSKTGGKGMKEVPTDWQERIAAAKQAHREGAKRFKAKGPAVTLRRS